MALPKVEVLLKACCSTIGEGPHWDVETQTLYFVDIRKGDIHRWDSATNKESKINLDGTIGAVIPREKGGLVIGLNRSIAVVDWDTQKVDTLAEVELAGTNNRFNDAKCDPVGRLWTGTMGDMESPDKFERHMGCLYSMSLDLTLTKHVSDIDISNGLAWTDDNKVMYYIDSIPKKVYAYDYDIDTGTITNQRVAIDFEKEGIAGMPDGMCIDVEGKLWIACFGGSQVARCDPQTGKLLQTVKFPTTDITSACFGGKNLDELYVTCSGWLKDLDKEPMAGSVFRVTDVGVKGTVQTKFKG